jgi:ATP-dependent protease Clp ATPase subunit
MSCTCTEDKEQIGKVIIGRNKVTCQECLDNNVKQEKQRRKQEKQAKLQELELKNLRKIFDGEDLTEVNAQRSAIRSEIQSL